MVSTVDLNTVAGLSELEAIADLCHFTKEALFGRKTLGLAVLQGVGILVIVFVVFVVGTISQTRRT